MCDGNNHESNANRQHKAQAMNTATLVFGHGKAGNPTISHTLTRSARLKILMPEAVHTGVI